METSRIQSDFPILRRKINGFPLVYLDNAATTQKPQVVIDAVVDFYTQHNANIHRGIHTLSQEASEMVDQSRQVIADFVGVKSKEIVFTRNATEGTNLFMYTWAEQNLKKGDAIMITGLEHHANLVPWQAIANKKNLELRVVRFDHEGEIIFEGESPIELMGQVKIGSLKQLLDEKVKLIALSHASNVLGSITGPGKIRQLLKKKKLEAKIILDASQTVPHMPVNFAKLGVDAAVFSGHKMLGPTGTGVFWAKQDLLESMEPFLFGGDMIQEVYFEKSTWNEPPYKFEAGTPNIAGIIGLGAAVAYLNKMGMDSLWQHEQELTNYALEQLKSFVDEGWVRTYGSSSARSRLGVISFNVEGVHAHDTAQVLDHYGIAVRSGQHCAAPLLRSLDLLATARASFYLYNTKKDIDRWIEALPEVKKVMLN